MTVAVCIEPASKFARYTVYDGKAVPKGTLMKLSAAGVNFAYNSEATDVITTPVAGIAAFEKVAEDGTTEISCALNGTWDIVVNGGNITACGDAVSISGADTIGIATEAGLILGGYLGTALEVGVHGTAIRVRVDVGN